MPYAWQITGPGEPLVRQEVAPLVRVAMSWCWT